MSALLLRFRSCPAPPPKITPSISYPTSWAKDVGTFEPCDLMQSPAWAVLFVLKALPGGSPVTLSEETLRSVLQQHHQPVPPRAVHLPGQPSLPALPLLSSRPRTISPPYLNQDRAFLEINFTRKQREKLNTQGEHAAGLK